MARGVGGNHLDNYRIGAHNMSYVFHTSKNGEAVVTANVYWVVLCTKANGPSEVVNGPYLDIGDAQSKANDLQEESALDFQVYEVYATQLDLIKAMN
jgi:hypothetical protein